MKLNRIKSGRGLAIGLALVALAVGSYFLDLSFLRQSPGPGAGRETTVELVQVRRESLPKSFNVSGELRPSTRFDIVSPLDGKVTELRFRVGEWVNAGAAVATVQADALERRVSERTAALGAAKEELQLRQSELAQAEQRVSASRALLDRELISRSDLAKTESVAAITRAQVELARANLAQQEAMLAQLGALRDSNRIMAPASGVVSRILVKPGARVSAQGVLMTLVDLSELRLSTEIAGENAQGLQVGRIAQVVSPALPGVIAAGKVSRLEPLPGGARGNYGIEIALANQLGNFRPGMAAEAKLELDSREELLLVPRAAIVWENRAATVFKMHNQRALRQPVKLGRTHGDEVEVTEGLRIGDAVIVNYPKDIEPNARLRPVSESSTGGPSSHR